MIKPKKLTERITVRICPLLKERLEKKAKKLDVSLNTYINVTLINSLKRKK